MKTLKSAILIVLMLAIGVCGYMVYQEYFETQEPKEPQEQTELYSPEITKVNDSTYHINISEDMCATLMKDADTLNINVVGARLVMATKDNDTVTIIPKYSHMYNIIYSDYFDSTRFEHINVRFKGN